MAKPFRTAPMKDGIRYDSRGEPVTGTRCQRTEPEPVVALDQEEKPDLHTTTDVQLREALLREPER